MSCRLMNRLLRLFVIGVVCFWLASLPSLHTVRADQTKATTSNLTALSLLPEKITIIGADRVQQLVVTGHYPNEVLRDLTSSVALRVADARIAKVGAAGLLLPLENGTTTV